MTLGRIDSVMIGTEDTAKLKSFYGEKLGLEKSMEDGGFVAYKLPQGDAQIVIGPHSAVHGKSKDPDRVMLNFSVDNCVQTYEELKGRAA
jgi:catechol 2,3-dioxygenase-like lactoylglutathione lyase family enzyme